MKMHLRRERVLVVLAMRRSGHHAVVNQMCHQLARVLHLNNCKKTFYFGVLPIKGRCRLYDHHHIVDSGVLSCRQFRRMFFIFRGRPWTNTVFQNARRNLRSGTIS